MDSYPLEAMRSSQITLREKLGVVISTQYPNDFNAMLDEIDKSKKQLTVFLTNAVFLYFLNLMTSSSRATVG